MLSLAICATGDALDRHEPVYQLDRFAVGDGLADEASFGRPYVSTMGLLVTASVSSPGLCCVVAGDWLLEVLVSVGWLLLGFDFFDLDTMLDGVSPEMSLLRFQARRWSRGIVYGQVDRYRECMHARASIITCTSLNKLTPIGELNFAFPPRPAPPSFAATPHLVHPVRASPTTQLGDHLTHTQCRYIGKQ